MTTRKETLERIAALAQDQWLNENIDLDAPSEDAISEGESNGCYYRAWVWVSFDGTELDKDRFPAGQPAQN